MWKDTFKYGFIDGNWVLQRNFCALGGQNGEAFSDDYGPKIASSVLASFLKITSWFKLGKIIILWDTAPYHKIKFLGDYKGDRYNPMFEDIESIENEEDRRYEENNRHNYELRGEAKSILQSLGSIGLPSIYLQGFEADDLAYLMSKYCAEHNDDCVLISIDGDWNSWMNKTSCIYNPKRDTMYQYEEICKADNLQDGMSLFQFKSLCDAFYGSHNNLYKVVAEDKQKEDCHEFFKEFYQKGFTKELFSDPDLAKRQLMSFDFSKYDNYGDVEKLCSMLDKIGTVPSMPKLASTLSELGLSNKIDKFQHYYSTLDKNLFE